VEGPYSSLFRSCFVSGRRAATAKNPTSPTAARLTNPDEGPKRWTIKPVSVGLREAPMIAPKKVFIKKARPETPVEEIK
jgi:hypothetical protein